MSTATAPEPAAAERPTSRARRLATKPAVRIALAVLGFGAVTLVTCLIARYRIFTGFAAYDDEGYMLTALNSFIQHGSLYDDVFTQYGPFYYELWGGLFSVFGLDVSHDAGRTVTLVVWVLASLLVGLSAARMTSSVLLGLVTQMLTFSTISTLVNEPMHPGGAICLLLGAILAISCAVGRRPSFGAMGLLGGAIAALILVKVNVGFFALAALALVAVVSYPYLGRLRWLRPLVEVGFVALPVVLMTSELGEGWARHYAVHVAAAALGVVIVLRSRLTEKRSDEELAWFAGGLVLTGAVICLAVIGAGTSPGGLFEGVISQPLRQGDAFTIPFGLSDRTYLLDLIALGGAFGYAYGVRGREGQLSGGWLPAISLLSILVGVEMGLSVIGKALPFDQTGFGGYSLSMLGFAWVALIPISGGSSSATSFARLLLPPLAVLQALHAFPVAGSQVAWSSFLLAPVAAVCVAGGVRGLARSVGEPRQLRGLAIAGSIAAVSLSVYLVDLTLRDPLRVSRARLQLAGTAGPAWGLKGSRQPAGSRSVQGRDRCDRCPLLGDGHASGDGQLLPVGGAGTADRPQSHGLADPFRRSG